MHVLLLYEWISQKYVKFYMHALSSYFLCIYTKKYWSVHFCINVPLYFKSPSPSQNSGPLCPYVKLISWKYDVNSFPRFLYEIKCTNMEYKHLVCIWPLIKFETASTKGHSHVKSTLRDSLCVTNGCPYQTSWFSIHNRTCLSRISDCCGSGRHFDCLGIDPDRYLFG